MADFSVFARPSFTFKNTHAAVFPPTHTTGGFWVSRGSQSFFPPWTRGLKQVGRALLGKADFGLARDGTGPVTGGKWRLGSLLE